MICVVTGFTKNYHYGHEFLRTFFEYWPDCVEIICYTEEPVDMPRGINMNLNEIPGYQDFMDRNDTPQHNGTKKSKCWNVKEIGNKYSFKTDTRKFALQGFIPRDALNHVYPDYLIWMDADVVTYKPVTMEYLYRILAGDLTYLGRKNTHSEIGFVGYKLPACEKLIQRFHDFYHNDKVLKMAESHSAYVFDQARERSNVNENNLTPEGRGHAWFQSPLSLRFDHQKGQRKNSGGSKELSKWDLNEMFKEYDC